MLFTGIDHPAIACFVRKGIAATSLREIAREAHVTPALLNYYFRHKAQVQAGLTDPDYTYWNVGLAFTYKVFTLDLRYHGTDQSRSDCGSFLAIAPPGNSATKWCNDTFIATLKVDTTLSALGIIK